MRFIGDDSVGHRRKANPKTLEMSSSMAIHPRERNEQRWLKKVGIDSGAHSQEKMKNMELFELRGQLQLLCYNDQLLNCFQI